MALDPAAESVYINTYTDAYLGPPTTIAGFLFVTAGGIVPKLIAGPVTT